MQLVYTFKIGNNYAIPFLQMCMYKLKGDLLMHTLIVLNVHLSTDNLRPSAPMVNLYISNKQSRCPCHWDRIYVCRAMLCFRHHIVCSVCVCVCVWVFVVCVCVGVCVWCLKHT